MSEQRRTQGLSKALEELGIQKLDSEGNLRGREKLAEEILEENRVSAEGSTDKLVLLVGASGAGKTTIAKELEKEGYNIIHSYTTREPREKNEWGHTFITRDEFSAGYGITDKWTHYAATYNYSPIIAYFEGYDEIYFATESQFKGKGTSIYILDPSGARDVRRSVDKVDVVTIYLQADRLNRNNRITERQAKAIGRDKLLQMGSQEIKGLDKERADRLEQDEEIFRIIECDYAVDANRSVKEVLEDVIKIIGGN